MASYIGFSHGGRLHVKTLFSSMRHFAVVHLVTTVSELNMKSWEEIKLHLVKVIWVEPICELPFRELGEEVTTKRVALELVELWQEISRSMVTML
jgi:hypothetical protein